MLSGNNLVMLDPASLIAINMEKLIVLSNALKTIVTWAGKASAWLAIALMLTIVLDVTLRHWFVIGSTRLQELEWHLHGGLFLMCMGWAFVHGTHVRIELLSDRLKSRSKIWLELLGCLFFLIPYVSVTLYFALDYAATSFSYNEASPSLTGLGARWIIKYVMVAGLISLVLAGIARLLDCILYLSGYMATPESIHLIEPKNRVGNNKI